MSLNILKQFLEDIEEDSDLLEKLSALEHDQWVDWAKAILKSEDISSDRAERWQTLFIPYEDLSEESKEQDREWGRKVLDIIKENQNG